ncbi:MAG: DinB family protein [Armatimonadota bacterium]
MFNTIDHFLQGWGETSANTQRLLDGLTDASLARQVSPEGRTLGQIAWHLALTLGEMGEKAGLRVDAPAEDAPAPASAAAISAAYRAGAASLVEAIRADWTDATLAETIPMYGEHWTRGKVLFVLLIHEVHHRGQLTVLMRQAGLRVPDVCGPAREDWAQWGLPVPP